MCTDVTHVKKSSSGSSIVFNSIKRSRDQKVQELPIYIVWAGGSFSKHDSKARRQTNKYFDINALNFHTSKNKHKQIYTQKIDKLGGNTCKIQ